jgi:hypothetical protein
MRLLATRLTAIASAVKRLFSPASLFRNSEQGVWYDPSDFSTMFQDSAGTTPVTAVEQPVGLILDKSRGLVLGSELVTNGGFDTSSNWATTGGTISISGGVLTVTRSGGSFVAAGQSLSFVSGRTYKISVRARRTSGSGNIAIVVRTLNDGSSTARFTVTPTPTGSFAEYSAIYVCSNTETAFLQLGVATADGVIEFDDASMKELPGNHATQATAARRPVLSARVNLLLASETMSTQNVTTTAIPYTLQFTGTGTVTLSGTSTAGPLVGGGTLTFTPTAGTLTLTVTGSVTVAQLETGSTATRYQSITTATSYDTVGFKTYLKFDGIDDALATASTVDFTATDKMTVVAGVRKLRDAAVGTILELSANSSTTAGSMALFGPRSNGITKYGIHLNGSTANERATDTAFAAPITSVLVASFDIAATTELSLRVSRVAQALSVVLSSGDAGTGNLGNHTLYVGSRGGTTLPFNGHLYSLIIRGAQSTVSQIAAAESYVNSKTGAY